MADSHAISWLPGHGSKLKGWDPGTLSPAGWSEADLVRQVTAAAWLACERAHIPSKVVSAGDYSQRGKDAESGSGSALIVQLHTDAVEADVGPDESRVFWYPGGAERAALDIAAELRKVVPWRVRTICADLSWKNARACLASVGPASVLVELGFADGAAGRVKLPELVEPLGAALAAGAQVWRARG